MPLVYPSSESSIWLLLSGKSLYFQELYNHNYNLELTNLLEATKGVIQDNAEVLERASAKRGYHLERLLNAMLDYAPHASGKLYVATVLKIANDRGHEVVVTVAEAWGSCMKSKSFFAFISIGF